MRFATSAACLGDDVFSICSFPQKFGFMLTSGDASQIDIQSELARLLHPDIKMPVDQCLLWIEVIGQSVLSRAIRISLNGLFI